MTGLSLASEFRWVEGGVSQNGEFFRNLLLRVDEIQEFRRKYDNTGIYITAYRYNSKDKENAELYGNFYLDFDAGSDKVGYEQVKMDVICAVSFFRVFFHLKDDEFLCYFSGKKGIHFIIPADVLGVNPDKELNEIYRLIARDIWRYTQNKTVDLRIYDRVRLFRLPNSQHPDTGLYKVPLTYKQFMQMSYEEVQAWAKKPRKHPPLSRKRNEKAHQAYLYYVRLWQETKHKQEADTRRREKRLDFCPPCIRHLLHHPAEEGRRNNTVAILASYLLQRGYSEAQAIDRLLRWNKRYCSPPLKEREIRTTVKSIYRGGYTYGCTTLESFSVCDKYKCRLVRCQK